MQGEWHPHAIKQTALESDADHVGMGYLLDFLRNPEGKVLQRKLYCVEREVSHLKKAGLAPTDVIQIFGVATFNFGRIGCPPLLYFDATFSISLVMCPNFLEA